ncbi:MAG: amidophosphoribosyltransferase [Candidatus Bathyarchaeia archaeon]
MYEHCGVIGVYSLEGQNIVSMLLLGLQAQQHRGQETWGIAVPSQILKRTGVVSLSVEKEPKIAINLNWHVGIGHVRYSTTAKSVLRNAHPLQIGEPGDINSFRIAHNGTLERNLLIDGLEKLGVKPDVGLTDTELMGIGLYQNLKKGKTWTEAFESLNPYLNGSFSVVILTGNGELIVARDEKGFRPLCLGWHRETSSYIVASESCALDAINAQFLRDIKPGEILKINGEGVFTDNFSVQVEHAHCPFEYTYFANPTSRIEGINVYIARKNIGRILAEKYPIDADIVVPVPDSARPAALGYSERAGIPFEEGLMKDRYRKKGSWRSFIEPRKREEVVSNIVEVKEVVENKRIVLIDDSIVRGTSSKIIVNKLRNAREVSMLLTFPPILYPCYMGIDFPTQRELLAYRVSGTRKSLEEINAAVAKYIGVRFLGYNDIDGLCKGIGMPKSELCLSCVTGNYACLRRKPEFKTRREVKFR